METFTKDIFLVENLSFQIKLCLLSVNNNIVIFLLTFKTVYLAKLLYENIDRKLI